MDHLDPADETIHTVQLADSAGAVRLLNFVNSLDTPVGHVETRHWDSLRAELPPGVHVYTISMDLPYAQARWQALEGVAHQVLSAHRGEQFGRDYGVLLKEWRLVQRAVFAIDRNDRVVYSDYVAGQMREPDYAAALEVATGTAGAGHENSAPETMCL